MIMANKYFIGDHPAMPDEDHWFASGAAILQSDDSRKAFINKYFQDPKNQRKLKQEAAQMMTDRTQLLPSEQPCVVQCTLIL
ncbi:hypothetical protein GPALN_006567 [Globodera pallida]|nr:hypothetical protein GPALN_006567 [Globodera pallida]